MLGWNLQSRRLPKKRIRVQRIEKGHLGGVSGTRFG
jgi:hypothetical protein